MLVDVIHLKDYYKIENDPIIEIVRAEFDDNKKYKYRPLIVVPGGAYKFIGNNEGDPVCLKFLVEGYATIKLSYSTNYTNFIYHYPTQHLELCCAIDFIRNKGHLYNIDSAKIAVMGFSAGGHLVGSYAYKYSELGRYLGLNNIDTLRPDVLCLSYPVVTMKENTHRTSMMIITNNEPILIDELSINENIDKNYPPTFLWNTKEDNIVNPINTILLDQALEKNGVMHKTIIFEHGGHGLSIGNALSTLDHLDHDDIKDWVKNCLDFFEQVFKGV